jgi:hypothetical protein
MISLMTLKERDKLYPSNEPTKKYRIVTTSTGHFEIIKYDFLTGLWLVLNVKDNLSDAKELIKLDKEAGKVVWEE